MPRNAGTKDGELTPTTRQASFLAAYSVCAQITKAAKIAKIPLSNHYDWLARDKNYPKLFKKAHEKACHALEAEMIRRGSEGYLEPVFYKGETCGAIRRFSDTLLIFALKGNLPEKYKDRTEYSGEVRTKSFVELIEDAHASGKKHGAKGD